METQLYDVFYKGEYLNTVNAVSERQAAGYVFHVMGPKDKSKKTPCWNDGKDWSAKIHNEDEEDNMFKKVSYTVDEALMERIKLYAKSKRIPLSEAVNQMLSSGFNEVKDTLEGEQEEYFKKNDNTGRYDPDNIPWRIVPGRRTDIQTYNGVKVNVVKCGSGRAISFTVARNVPFETGAYIAVSEFSKDAERIYFRLFDKKAPYTSKLSFTKESSNRYLKTMAASEEEVNVIKERWADGPYKVILDKDYNLYYIDRRVKEEA